LAVVIVSIVVVSVAVGSYIVLDITEFCGCGGTPRAIYFSSMQADEGNWSMTVTSTPSSLALADVTITIYDSGGSIKMPMTSVELSKLTAANWTKYEVIYQKNGTGNEVVPGAIILVNQSSYPAGYRYEISDHLGILANGIFV